VTKIPRKLKVDAILEAVIELRFEPDSLLVPEIIFGRFADVELWKDFRQARLPMADIPAPIRRADPNLRYQPSIEMSSPDGSIAVRIGPQAVTYARRGNYPGWEKFGLEIDAVVDQLYRIIPKVNVSRIGLRYINALDSNLHGIKSVEQMAISISVADQPVVGSLNLNFKSNVGTNFETMCRIATIDMAEGAIPDNATVIVDIDVYTQQEFSTTSAVDVKKWVSEAHLKEKESFFTVLGEEATARLRED
jgi:uncharacterized protein (TIGR04255 family)